MNALHPSCILKLFRKILVLFILSFSPAFAAEFSSQHGGQLVDTTTSDPRSFNDITAKETSTSAVTSLIFEGLTTVNAHSLKIEPHLAKSWSVSDDGLIWTFVLRDNVLWNDGVRFSADDVVFTFNSLIYNPGIASSARDVFTIDGHVFKVEKVDDFSVRFVLPVRFAPFLRSMSQAILPKHKLEQAVLDGKFNFMWGIDTAPEEIVGTGPYKLVKYEPGQRLIFERNPYYWKKDSDDKTLPYMSRLVLMILQSEDIELLKFFEGSVDTYSLRGMDYPLLKPLEKKHNFTIYDLGPDMGSQFLFFNQNPLINEKTGQPFVAPHKLKWFTNVQFRRAVAHAIDKEKIIEIVKNGLGYPQHSPIGPAAGFFHNPDVAQYPFDLAKARELLKAEGFIDRDKDGYLEDADGKRVEFNLYTNAGASERIDIASIIRHDLESLGMKVNFQTLEFNTLVGKLTSTFDFDAVVLGLTGGIEPHFGQNVWASSGGLHMWYPRQVLPATDWERRIDEIYTLGVQELDENKRKILYDEFQVLVAGQVPLIYTVLTAKHIAVRNKFGNLKPSNYGGVFHNLEEIYVLDQFRK